MKKKSSKKNKYKHDKKKSNKSIRRSIRRSIRKSKKRSIKRSNKRSHKRSHKKNRKRSKYLMRGGAGKKGKLWRGATGERAPSPEPEAGSPEGEKELSTRREAIAAGKEYAGHSPKTLRSIERYEAQEKADKELTAEERASQKALVYSERARIADEAAERRELAEKYKTLRPGSDREYSGEKSDLGPMPSIVAKRKEAVKAAKRPPGGVTQDQPAPEAERAAAAAEPDVAIEVARQDMEARRGIINSAQRVDELSGQDRELLDEIAVLETTLVSKDATIRELEAKDRELTAWIEGNCTADEEMERMREDHEAEMREKIEEEMRGKIEEEMRGEIEEEMREEHESAVLEMQATEQVAKQGLAKANSTAAAATTEAEAALAELDVVRAKLAEVSAKLDENNTEAEANVELFAQLDEENSTMKAEKKENYARIRQEIKKGHDEEMATMKARHTQEKKGLTTELAKAKELISQLQLGVDAGSDVSSDEYFEDFDNLHGDFENPDPDPDPDQDQDQDQDQEQDDDDPDGGPSPMDIATSMLTDAIDMLNGILEIVCQDDIVYQKYEAITLYPDEDRDAVDQQFEVIKDKVRQKLIRLEAGDSVAHHELERLKEENAEQVELGVDLQRQIEEFEVRERDRLAQVIVITDDNDALRSELEQKKVEMEEHAEREKELAADRGNLVEEMAELRRDYDEKIRENHTVRAEKQLLEGAAAEIMLAKKDKERMIRNEAELRTTHAAELLNLQKQLATSSQSDEVIKQIVRLDKQNRQHLDKLKEEMEKIPV